MPAGQCAAASHRDHASLQQSTLQPLLRSASRTSLVAPETASQPADVQQSIPPEREPISLSSLPHIGAQQISTPTANTVTINSSDFALLLQNMLKPNPHGISYDKNIIPNFDPTQKNQKIESWIAKVNECAKIYNWSDEQTSHFALPKLIGHAQKWYQGLQTIL